MKGGDDQLLDSVAELLEWSGVVEDAPASKLEAALTLLARAGIDVPSAYTPALVEPTPAEADDEVRRPTEDARTTAPPRHSDGVTASTPVAIDGHREAVTTIAPASTMEDLASPEVGGVDLEAALERSAGADREDAAVDRLLTAELSTIGHGPQRRRPAGRRRRTRPTDREQADDRRRGRRRRRSRTKPEPRLVTGRTPGVVGGDPLAEAGRKILRFHFARMLEREAGTRSGEDIEDLHRMRVATRRMRAAWRLFGDAYKPKAERRYVRELRTVAASLGAVRDLDVLLENLAAYVAAHPAEEGAALQPLASRLAGAARGGPSADGRDARLGARTGISSRTTSPSSRPRARPPGRSRRPQPSRVRDTATSRIWGAYEQVRAYDATLAWADVATIHQLRIASKRLRYSLEFFREVLGPDAGPLIERVTRLQDHLGLLNDADVAARLAREFLVASAARLSPPTIEAVGRYLGARDRDVARLRRSLPAAWRPLAAESFRRALGRAVSAL